MGKSSTNGSEAAEPFGVRRTMVYPGTNDARKRDDSEMGRPAQAAGR